MRAAVNRLPAVQCAISQSMHSRRLTSARCAQVWTNCRLYNAEGSDIARACKRLEKAALASWKEHDLPRKHGSAGEPLKRQYPLPSWRESAHVLLTFRRGHSKGGAGYCVIRGLACAYAGITS